MSKKKNENESLLCNEILTRCVNLIINPEVKASKISPSESEDLIDDFRKSLQDNKITLESSIKPFLNAAIAISNRLQALILLELCVFISQTDCKSNQVKTLFGKLFSLILKTNYLSESDFTQLMCQLDKQGTSIIQGISSKDRINIISQLAEKIASGQVKSLSESIRVCSRLGSIDKKECLEVLSIVIRENDIKIQQLKQNNGERIDAFSLLIFLIFQDQTCIYEKQEYPSFIEIFSSFLSLLMNQVLQQQQSSYSQRISKFIQQLLNDLTKQLYSSEYIIAPELFISFYSILISYVKQETYQNNIFLLDTTKYILKNLYSDTQQIIEFSKDMTFTLQPSSIKNKKSKNNGSLFCGVCSEVGFFTLKQNEHELSFCQDCCGFNSFNLDLSNISNLTDIFIHQQDLSPFCQSMIYYLEDQFQSTANQNFLSSQNLLSILYELQMNSQTKMKALCLNRNITNTNQDEIKLGTNELDFLDFIYKVKIQMIYGLEDKLEFLLKYICALTDDNSASIRNKSLQILNEIDGFNSSPKFEQYLSLRKLDQQPNVRLTCLRILDSRFSCSDQQAFESEDDYRKRKDRYFKLIIDRFNDKDNSVRSAVLSFISNHISSFNEDVNLRLSLIRELVTRISKDLSSEIEKASLDILTKVYFPLYKGEKLTSKANKKKGQLKQKQQSPLNKDEESTLNNILSLQKGFEASTDILIKIFEQFISNHQESEIFMRQLFTASLISLEDELNNSSERRYVLGVVEAMIKAKNIFDCQDELVQVFIPYLNFFVQERNQFNPTQKEKRAESNLCLVIILEILQSLIKNNGKCNENSSNKLEESLMNLIQKETNLHVLKELLQLSCIAAEKGKLNIQKVSNLFLQRFNYLKQAKEDDSLFSKLQVAEQQNREFMIFKISSSLSVIGTCGYYFIQNAFQSLSITIHDIAAILLYFLQFPFDKIQSQSLESLSYVWERDDQIIFSCQEILHSLLSNQNTSTSLLSTIFTTFDKCIKKHLKQINSKTNQLSIIKSQPIPSDQSSQVQQVQLQGEEDHENITSVIREILLKSQETSLFTSYIPLKQMSLQLFSSLIKEHFVLFQQVGSNIIPLVCDPDPLTRSIANNIIQDENGRNLTSIGLCLKQGFKKSAIFIDENYDQFTIIEKVDGKPISFFERINNSFKIKDATNYNSNNIFCKKSLEVLQEIQDWSYEDHEIAFFISMMLVSLNTIYEADLLAILFSLRQISEAVYYDVQEFLKKAWLEEEQYFENEGDGKDFDHSQRSFIKANILLMCLVTSHLLIYQSKISPAKNIQLDLFILQLQQSHEEIELKGIKVIKKLEEDSQIFDGMIHLFLEQMREFDCSDMSQMNTLNMKINYLFQDSVSSDISKILDLTYWKGDSHASKAINAHNKLKNKGKSKKETENVLKPNFSKLNLSYNSCKQSKKFKNDDLEFNSRTSQSAVNSRKINLRSRLNAKVKYDEDQNSYEKDDQSESNDITY